MQAGDLDVALGGVDADDLGPKARQRFGQQAAAAADIDDAETLQRQHARRVAAEPGTDRVADIADADRVVFVQRLELAARVPPFRRDGAEAGDLPGVHRTAKAGAACGGGFSGGGGRGGAGSGIGGRHGYVPGWGSMPDTTGSQSGQACFASPEIVWIPRLAPAMEPPVRRSPIKKIPDRSGQIDRQM